VIYTNVLMTAARFVFVGIGHLMEQIIIASARHLQLPNAYGVKKIIRNILALQQSIKSITDDKQLTEFEQAKQYYSMFFESPQVKIHHFCFI
jgi:exocyst complex component 4